jgi:Uma2 family endonuclease
MLSPMFDPSLVEPERIRPLSRKEYDRMVELGMFEDEHIELLGGALVTMSPQGWLHTRVVAWLTEQLIRQLDTSFEVRPQGPFAASDCSEPEPDIAVAAKDYALRDHPDRLFLVIEVSGSSLRKDSTVKLEIYAEAGVPEYWIVDLETMTVEVHTQPGPTGYANRCVLRDGDTLEPTLLPTVALPVATIPR